MVEYRPEFAAAAALASQRDTLCLPLKSTYAKLLGKVEHQEKSS